MDKKEIKEILKTAYQPKKRLVYLSLFYNFMKDGKLHTKREIATYILSEFINEKIAEGYDTESPYFKRWSFSKAKTIKNQVDLMVSHTKHLGGYTNNPDYDGIVERVKEDGIFKYRIVKEG